MEIRNNLELVAVDYENDGNKAIMTFLDRERSEVRVVNWNKQIYQNNKWVSSEEKAEKVEGWSSEYFGCSFAEIGNCLGVLKDVYVYDNFNSLYPVNTIAKFTADMMGEIYPTEITEIIVDNIAIRIRYEIEDKTYESKMTFAKWIDSMKQYIVDPQSKKSKFAKFEEKFGIPVEQKDELIGRQIMVEVKKAFGNNFWGDIKKFPKKG